MIATLPETTCKPLPEAQYHADRSAWSKGMLFDFLERRSVCHARHVLRTAPEKKMPRCVDIGDVAHVALLQPERLATHYVTYPTDILATNGAVSTKEAKAFRDVHQAAGKVVLKESEFAIVERMVTAVTTSKIGKWFECAATIEHSIYWTEPVTELRCRCRPDFLVVTKNQAIILDIKTTGDASPWQFQRRVEDGGYWLQDAHYSAGVEAAFGLKPVFLFVAVETEWPHQCGIYELSFDDKFRGKEAREQTLVDVATCIETGDWSDDWTRDVVTLNLRKHIYPKPR